MRHLEVAKFFRHHVRRRRYAAGVTFEHWPGRIYAIGDIHGRYDLLRALERVIIADAATQDGECLIVTLGDMVDRGSASRQVVSHLMQPLPTFRRIALMGNHEAMMLDFLRDPTPTSNWLHNGGIETLASFGMEASVLMSLPWVERKRVLLAQVGADTARFLLELPTYVLLPGMLLVHAGIRPGVPIERQALADLLWIRDKFLNAERDDGLMVVHGHTPSGMPQVRRTRLGIDTGAYYTGILTAACLEEHKAPRILPVGPVKIWPDPTS